MAGSILREPEEQKESRSFCRLPSGEAASLRASRPSSALSSRGFHGSGSSTGARDARAGGGEAAVAREQGRYLSPTSELFSPPPPHSLPRPVPEAPGIGLRPGSGARPRPEPACRPRAPGSRPGRHLPGLEATSSSSQTLPTVSPYGRPGRGSTSPARPAGGTPQESGEGVLAARTSSPALARAAPWPAQELEEPGLKEGGGDEPDPTPAHHRERPAHLLALTPFRLFPVLSDRLLDQALSLFF